MPTQEQQNEQQMIDYGNRMRKRAEKAEAELDAIKHQGSIRLNFDQIKIVHTLIGVGVKSGHLSETEHRHAIAASKELASATAALACGDCGQRAKELGNGLCRRCNSYQQKYKKRRSESLTPN